MSVSFRRGDVIVWDVEALKRHGLAHIPRQYGKGPFVITCVIRNEKYSPSPYRFRVRRKGLRAELLTEFGCQWFKRHK